MSRKDYIALAHDLHIDYLTSVITVSDDMKAGFMLAVHTICDALQRDNSRFNKQRFITAVIEGK